MADTAHTPTAQDSPASRQIRVFLSSTFRDFMEERDLLVKQVFPRLRKHAQERGVDVVDVDLRWGVTQEESEQGKVIGICLAEIERCRPYFIGMLGERYGWTPGKTDYPDELFEREQLGWIRDHQGNASVTELEILHGVLNDKEMAGRAFFYFRDPAWSRAQSEPGFVCDTPEEEAKLAVLKDRIRASGFPVAKDLPDPKAIADQIEADLWALIEEQYPDLDQADALEREARKHASYRQSRLGVYLGQEYVDQLEALVSGGEQKILITGESGSGKSALIANWMHQHEREHPADVVYAHHLGCSNDANAIRPVLGRMLDTASKLLKEAELIREPIQVPQDWWELTAKVAETLQDLGRWCRNTGHRWIWVLDGLDRLAADDQQALPWLPLLIPEGVSVVISALECPARAILLERQFQLLEIGPLRRNEQEQLIELYLGRYTKKLEAERKEQILACDLARSPLFLRVLLEELRQCGRFETLKDQINAYIRPKADGSLAVSDLYERVLERLENDCGIEVVRKVMSALWASRAGLSETELLATTGLAPLLWAPIDLALEQAISRNGNQLVFDHDYLRSAVQQRYLETDVLTCQAHDVLADWFLQKGEWNSRDAQELPFQLLCADRVQDLRDHLLYSGNIAFLAHHLGSHEVLAYWQAIRDDNDEQLDDLLADDIHDQIQARKDDESNLIQFLDRLIDFLGDARLYREVRTRLAVLRYELSQTLDATGEQHAKRLNALASVYRDAGQFQAALDIFQKALEEARKFGGDAQTDTLSVLSNYACLLIEGEDFATAESMLVECLESRIKNLGAKHPLTITVIHNLGALYFESGNHDKAMIYFTRCIEARSEVLGSHHPDTLISKRSLAEVMFELEKHGQAKVLISECLRAQEKIWGDGHPDTLISRLTLGSIAADEHQFDKAEWLLSAALEGLEKLYGSSHKFSNDARNRLAEIYSDQDKYSDSIPLRRRSLEIAISLYGADSPESFRLRSDLANDLYFDDQIEEAEALYRSSCEGLISNYGVADMDSIVARLGLAALLSDTGRQDEAETHYKACLGAQESLHGINDECTLITLSKLADCYIAIGHFVQAEASLKRCLRAREMVLGFEHPDTNSTRYGLANLLSDQERYGESIPLRRQELEVAAKRDGRDAPGTLTSIHRLAEDLYWADEFEESEQLYLEALAGRITALGDDDAATMASRYGLARCLSAQARYCEAIELRRVELAWCQANDDVDAKDMLISMHGLGCDLLAAGETEEALEVLQICLSQRRAELGVSDDDTLGTLARVLEALSSVGRQQEGLELSQDVQQALAAEMGENDPRVLNQIVNQAILYEDIDEIEQAEVLYRRCLAGREAALGPDHPDTVSTAFSLAEVLSEQERHAEAIPLRRRELAWCREQNGDTDSGTLTSINALAIDLRETGELMEAEALFRELVAGRQQVLEPSDFGIGRALSSLAKTLEDVGKLEEAATFAQQALDHRLEHEGPDTWWTNRERLDLARVLHKLDRSAETLRLLDELQQSMEKLAEPDEADQQLLVEAKELRQTIMPDGLRS